MVVILCWISLKGVNALKRKMIILYGNRSLGSVYLCRETIQNIHQTGCGGGRRNDILLLREQGGRADYGLRRGRYVDET